MEKINDLSWQRAQAKERNFHRLSYEAGVEKYKKGYLQYFEHLGIHLDQQGKTICEIGPADFPALGYCHNYGKSYIIEPMHSEILQEYFIKACNDLILLQAKAESCLHQIKVDEIWLMNVLQHTQDPDKIIWKAKRAANIIRYFEPINFGTDPAHLHNFTLEYFEKKLGPASHYPFTPDAVEFHTHECAYGIWEK